MRLRHDRRLGQCFLAAPEILDEIAELLPLSGKTVLEIGAGDGRLTEALAEHAKKVVALELDDRLIGTLEGKFAGSRKVRIEHADALEFDFSSYKLIFGNLPYSISTPLLLKALQGGFEHLVFMLQAEFGYRLVAAPGSKDYSRLTVALQSVANAKIVDYVSRECFDPVPNVDSVLVHITPKPAKERVKTNPLLLNALFQHRNQNLRKALKHSRHLLGEEKTAALVEKIPKGLLAKSAKELSLQEFAELSRLAASA